MLPLYWHLPVCRRLMPTPYPFSLLAQTVRQQAIDNYWLGYKLQIRNIFKKIGCPYEFFRPLPVQRNGNLLEIIESSIMFTQEV